MTNDENDVNQKILKLHRTGCGVEWIDRSDVDLWNDVPPLTDERLFERDDYMCLYCGEWLWACDQIRDHVVPASLGGTDTWNNVVTACRTCSGRKAGRSIAEAESIGMSLLAVPYVPNRAEKLILAKRKVVADQMIFLSDQIGRGRGRWAVAH